MQYNAGMRRNTRTMGNMLSTCFGLASTAHARDLARTPQPYIAISYVSLTKRTPSPQSGFHSFCLGTKTFDSMLLLLFAGEIAPMGVSQTRDGELVDLWSVQTANPIGRHKQGITPRETNLSGFSSSWSEELLLGRIYSIKSPVCVFALKPRGALPRGSANFFSRIIHLNLLNLQLAPHIVRYMMGTYCFKLVPDQPPYN